MLYSGRRSFLRLASTGTHLFSTVWKYQEFVHLEKIYFYILGFRIVQNYCVSWEYTFLCWSNLYAKLHCTTLDDKILGMRHKWQDRTSTLIPSFIRAEGFFIFFYKSLTQDQPHHKRHLWMVKKPLSQSSISGFYILIRNEIISLSSSFLKKPNHLLYKILSSFNKKIIIQQTIRNAPVHW